MSKLSHPALKLFGALVLFAASASSCGSKRGTTTPPAPEPDASAPQISATASDPTASSTAPLAGPASHCGPDPRAKWLRPSERECSNDDDCVVFVSTQCEMPAMAASAAASPALQARRCTFVPLGACACAVPGTEARCNAGCCQMRIFSAEAWEPPNDSATKTPKAPAHPPTQSATCKPVAAPIDIGKPLPSAWLACKSKQDCTMARGGGCCWPMVVNQSHAAQLQTTLDEMACGVCKVTECEKDEPFECRQGQCHAINTTRGR